MIKEDVLSLISNKLSPIHPLSMYPSSTDGFDSSNDKNKRTLCCPMERHDGTWGSDGMVPFILNFGSRWR